MRHTSLAKEQKLGIKARILLGVTCGWAANSDL